MGEPHGHRLTYHAHSPLHRAPAHLKILALLAFAVATVAIPRGAWALFLIPLVIVLGAIAVSRVPLTYLLRRLVVETPFVVFALLMPFIVEGDRITVAGLQLSRIGIESGGTLIIRSTLCVLAALLLAATTEPAALIVGLQRLRLPEPLVQIASFMVRYVDVVSGEAQRMAVALRSRGFRARNPRHWGVIGRSLGALFIRSYERGERVHLAMLARGYAGRMPDQSEAPS